VSAGVAWLLVVAHWVLLAALYWKLTGMPACLWSLARDELAKTHADDDRAAQKALREATDARAGTLLASLRQYEEQTAAQFRRQIADAEIKAREAQRSAMNTGAALETATTLVRELRATLDALGGLPALVRDARMADAAAKPAADDDGRKTDEMRVTPPGERPEAAGPRSDPRTVYGALLHGDSPPTPPGEEPAETGPSRSGDRERATIEAGTDDAEPDADRRLALWRLGQKTERKRQLAERAKREKAETHRRLQPLTDEEAARPSVEVRLDAEGFAPDRPSWEGATGIYDRAQTDAHLRAVAAGPVPIARIVPVGVVLARQEGRPAVPPSAHAAPPAPGKPPRAKQDSSPTLPSHGVQRLDPRVER
jgi:hypothetical protein